MSVGPAPAIPSTSREIHLVGRPTGEPVPEDFAVVETGIPEPAPGQVLIRNSWMSVDPSTRIRMHERSSDYLPPFDLGKPLSGWAVGEVVRSAHPQYPVGQTLLHPYGWREYALARATTLQAASAGPVAVDEKTPERFYVGALGWVGLTSYVGLLDVGELCEGDVVFVSGAAGAVGGLAVQIAKQRGHFVIGSAGSAAKVAYVREELGADLAFCYRDGPVAEQLAAAVPGGIDLYFDNVGGDHLEAALGALRPHGRVVLCGAISTYNETAPPAGPSNLFEAVAKGLTLRGFLARMYVGRMEDFRAEMRAWLAAGAVTYPETVFEGIDSAPRALIAMLAGENLGKVVVHLG
jgi:NADPH-dependent curcumin reductase CurA